MAGDTAGLAVEQGAAANLGRGQGPGRTGFVVVDRGVSGELGALKRRECEAGSPDAGGALEHVVEALEVLGDATEVLHELLTSIEDAPGVGRLQTWNYLLRRMRMWSRRVLRSMRVS